MYSPVIGGRPASSAYAMPCGTSSAVRTSPATRSWRSHAGLYDQQARDARRNARDHRIGASGGIGHGSHRSANGLRRHVVRAWITSHTFRKTAATILDEAALSARLIADQLGHARPSMTQDVYL